MPNASAGPHPLGGEHAHEHPPLERRGEAEELPAVLAHHEVGVQRRVLAELGQPLVHAQRDGQLVAHPALGEDLDPVELLRDHPPGDVDDHRAASRARAGSG
jgi:hypothetical protein